MSATVDIGVVPDLNQQQVDAIIQLALSAGFYETGIDGQLHSGEALKRDALDLVRQSRLSFAAGSRHDAVVQILFVAEVETNPPAETNQGGTNMAAETQSLADYSDENIVKFYNTLRGYPAGPEVDESLQEIYAEANRRGLQLGEQAAPTAAPAAPVAEPAPQEAAPVPDRAGLENQLTFKIMRAHGVDPSDVPSITDDQLQWILAHPDGAGATDSTQVQTTPPEPEIPNPAETIQTTQVGPAPVPAAPAPEVAPVAAPKPDLGGISEERNALEEQISGPTLKAYKLGRKDVPSLSDTALQFMLDNPEAKVTPEAWAIAQGQTAQTPEEEQQDDDGFTPESAPEEKPKRGRKSAEAVSEAQAQPQAQWAAEDAQPAVVQGGNQVVAQVPNVQPIDSSTLPANPAQAMIDKENFPIPAEIEEKLHLPFDLSKCSDQDILSYHSRFHGLHARLNYVVGLWESELRDEAYLRKGQEIAVANSLGVKDPDDSRGKLTEARRETLIASDPQVKAHKAKEHEIEKVLRQLKVLLANAENSVAVCSRQLNRRDAEANGAR